MGMSAGRLTAAKVAAAARREDRRFYLCDGGGLYLQVTPGGASWTFRFRSRTERDSKGRAKLKEMGLGPLNALSLAQAREKAAECRNLLVNGKDPLAEKRANRQAAILAAAKAITFRECAEAYIAAHRAGWRNAVHAAQWTSSLAMYVYPVLGALPVDAVDLALVLRVIEPMWRNKTATAARVRGRIESVLDWAKTRGYRDGENPARWRGHLENLLPKQSKVQRVQHYAALPYVEIAGFMDQLRQRQTVAARAIEFTILTAARTGEVLGARWREIDEKNRLWIIPADRMKAGREHRVPLSDAAMAIVEKMKTIRSCDFVFPGQDDRGPLNRDTMTKTLTRTMHRTDLTVHGFRSTFSDWCAERTGYPAEVREMALAHAVSNAVEAAYRRGDMFEKRRRVMDDWAAFCAMPAPEGEVVPLRRGA